MRKRWTCAETDPCSEDDNQGEEHEDETPRGGSSSASSEDMDFESGSPEPESSPFPTKGPILAETSPAKSRFRPPDGFRAPLKAGRKADRGGPDAVLRHAHVGGVQGAGSRIHRECFDTFIYLFLRPLVTLNTFCLS